MMLACTGFVSLESGSVSAANALLLRALLDLGMQVDFFSKPSFVDPRPAVGNRAGFTFIPVINFVADAFRRTFAKIPIVGVIASRIDATTYNRQLVQRIREEHAKKKYDAVVWMGDYAHGIVAGVPTVSFAQGQPGTDARSVIRRTAEIERLAGKIAALKWQILARLRLSRLGLPRFDHSDHFIVGSSVSRTGLAEKFGLAVDSISTLPYPIDLQLFKPKEGEVNQNLLRVLWLGRIVPRKRLDLFLDGAKLAIAQGLNITLTVVGKVGFVSGYEKLLKSFPYPERLRWVEGVPRADVPDLLRAHDVLAQPSEDEDFGSSVAEAQACGIAVVVGATNGNADYLSPRDIHLIDGQPETLAAAFHERMAQRGADLLGTAVSRRFAEQTFSVEIVARRLAMILQQVHARHKRPSCNLAPC